MATLLAIELALAIGELGVFVGDQGDRVATLSAIELANECPFYPFYPFLVLSKTPYL